MQFQTRIAAAIAVGLLVMTVSGQVVRSLPLPDALRNAPYFLSALSYCVDIFAMGALLRIGGGASFAAIWSAVALNRPFRASALMGLCIFLPAAVLMLVFGSVSGESGPLDLLFGGLLFPFAEEVTYRGLATGMLLAVCGWRFWQAALLPALIFGLGHATQGVAWGEVGSIVAITALGGLFFSWLYVAFGRNLWPAFVMHAGMNLVWSAFALGENVLGGRAGNLLRLAVVIAAIVFALKGQGWLRRVSGEAQAT